MFSAIRRMTGFSAVAEKDGIITVSGLPADFIAKDIKKFWTTSKIASSMFTYMSKNEVRFSSFFAIEFEYIIRSMLEQGGTTTGHRVIKNIIEGLHENTWMSRLKVNEETNVEYPKWLKREHLKEIKWKLLDHQALFLDRYERVKYQYGLRGMLLTAAAGGGKAQPLDAKIKVPGGWTTMGELKVGMAVSAPDGGFSYVTGIYPQGVKDIYEVTFVDGRKTRACADHLWEFVDVHEKLPEKRTKLINTMELKWHVHDRPRNRAYFNLISAEEGEFVDYPVDPYLLGVILGDGGTRHNRLTISSADQEIMDNVAKALPESCVIKHISGVDYAIVKKDKRQPHPLIGDLRTFDVMDKYSYEKFIPTQYLHGSREQRLAILQGLMDTDGTVNDHAVISFCSTSEQLAKDVQYLVRSLGGIARISQRVPQYTHNGIKKDGRVAYNVNIRYKKPTELFRLTRKSSRCNDQGQYVDNLKLRVTSVKLVGREEAQCISVSHPKRLYITDDFIITHNTISGISIALTTEADYCIIVSPKNAIYRVWEKTLNEEMVVPQKPYVADRDGNVFGDGKWFIFHYESLDKAMELAKKLRGKKVCVILDESHNFNDSKSLRTDRFLQMCNVCQASDIIWSSGTPIKALGYEAIPLIKSIDPMFNDTAEQGFRKMYGKDAKRTLDILKNRIGIVSYIVPKKEFMTDKPVEKTIKIQMPGSEKYTLEALSVVMKKFIDERNKFYAGKRQEYRKYYDAIIEIHKRTLRNGDQLSEFAQYEKIVAKFWKFGFSPQMDVDQAVFANKYEKEKIHLSIPQSERNKFKDAKSVVKYPELKVRGECLGRILSKERMQCHVDMLPYVNFEELINAVEKKTIIFTSYVQVVDACHSHLEKLKMTPLRVYGATNNELPAIVGRFGSDEKINPLIATYQSLAVAVPLTMANGVILLNAPWRAYEREQAIARAYRIGQDKTVYVHDIILDTGNKTNISSRSIDIMQWSKDQVDSIMGTEGTTVSAESDLDTVYDVRWNVQWSIEGAVDDINFEGYEVESTVPEVPFSNNRSVYW